MHDLETDRQLPTDLESVYQALPEEDRAEFLELAARRYDYQPIREFIPEVSPHLPPPDHTKIITDLIERAMREQIFAVISMPPRHAKTLTLLHCFAWWFKHNPADTCGYFTYSDRLGRRKSRIARDIARRAGIEINKESNDMSEWRTTLGGGLLAGGRGGGLTGEGVSGIFVIDDPFKNRKEADSVIIREDVWEWFTEVVTTRLEGASLIVVHTRWHEDDLIGRLEEMADTIPELDDLEIINLPALAEENDPLGREPGEALWPEKESAEELQRKRVIMGEWSFAALYGGHPRPRGANLFGEPAYYNIDEFKINGCSVVLGGDPAASTKTTADYSTAVVIAVRVEERTIKLFDWPEPRKMRLPVGYVQYVYREQVTVPKYVEDVRSLQKRWYNAKIGIEAVAGFKAVPQMLLHLDPELRVQEMPLFGDKFQRAQMVSAMWNAGLILLPVHTDGTSPPWVKAFVKEVCNFTGVNDATDDQVDGLAHAWNQIAYAPKPVRRGAVAVPSRWR
jgi:hypothetical protein